MVSFGRSADEAQCFDSEECTVRLACWPCMLRTWSQGRNTDRTYKASAHAAGFEHHKVMVVPSVLLFSHSEHLEPATLVRHCLRPVFSSPKQ